MDDEMIVKSTSKRKASDIESPEVPKRKKKKKKNKPRKSRNTNVADPDIDLEKGVNLAIGRMDTNLLADYISQRTKRFAGDLTLLEMEEKRIPASAICDTSNWGKPRSLELLSDFVQNYSNAKKQKGDLSKAPKEKGSPHTLVVAAAGLRAADLTRSLRIFQTPDATIAKLFAKHIKLSEAIESAKKTRMSIGVGTPARLIALLDSGALSSKHLERIVIDLSHIDQKKRGVLDMAETQRPLMDLLNRYELKERFGRESSGLKLLFF